MKFFFSKNSSDFQKTRVPLILSGADTRFTSEVKRAEKDSTLWQSAFWQKVAFHDILVEIF